mmetsp:Transcript_25477/g.29445  ORF Transcript_25477/g.29445 Transcript_25477/m.29445 type:complete len:99 (+) Transcript_25477:285-581(+)
MEKQKLSFSHCYTEASNAGTTQTPTTAPVVICKIVSNEEVISGNSAEKGTNGVADNDDTVGTTTTTPVLWILQQQQHQYLRILRLTEKSFRKKTLVRI